MDTAETSTSIRDTAPPAMRMVLLALLLGLCAGAVYLYAVRGNAIFLDLERMLCL